MRFISTLAASVIAALVLAVPVSAAPGPSAGTVCADQKLKAHYSANYYVRDAHGKRAPGRNIRRDGLTDRRKAKCRHLRKSNQTLRRMRHAGSYLLAGAPPRHPPAGTQTLRASGGILAAIRACESGGDYSTNTGNGFYGAYQFTKATWWANGGAGMPHRASPAEQDRVAAVLYSRVGTHTSASWPNCP